MGTTLSCLLLDAISTTAYLFLETLKMEISNKNLLALALALMALVSTGFALQCHQCNSYENADCDDPMSDLQADGSRVVKTNEFLKDCPADGNTYTLCRKIDQTIRGHESVIRSCGFEKKLIAREKNWIVIKQFWKNTALMFVLATLTVAMDPLILKSQFLPP